mmetsp:Transcript_8467/g.12631  ORF Transcript_8467/g.12631 Transcript_8467/m.12631 type:complete len:80 (+) Transcript_8467:127-366(+)
MPYINSDGSVVEERSKFRFSFITDIFWTLFDIVGIFWQTLFSPSYRPPTRPREPRRNISKGPNIRSMKPKGDMHCAAGG